MIAEADAEGGECSLDYVTRRLNEIIDAADPRKH